MADENKKKSDGSGIWVLPILGSIGAVLILVMGMQGATGAPQEAVVCALACAVAIIPYVFARSVSEIGGLTKQKKDDEP